MQSQWSDQCGMLIGKFHADDVLICEHADAVRQPSQEVLLHKEGWILLVNP